MEKQTVTGQIPIDAVLGNAIYDFQRRNGGMRPGLILMHPLVLERLKDWAEKSTSIEIHGTRDFRFMGIPIYRSEDLGADDFVVS